MSDSFFFFKLSPSYIILMVESKTVLTAILFHNQLQQVSLEQIYNIPTCVIF